MTTEITKVVGSEIKGTFTKKDKETLRSICQNKKIDYLEW